MTTTGRARTFLKGALLGLLFTMMLAASFAVADHVLPQPHRAVLSEKLSYIAEHGDEYTTLFLGSSRVLRELVPRIYDEQRAAGGHSERSFNLGVQGMLMPESLHVLRQVLAQRSKPLKRVFIELSPFAVAILKRNELSNREVAWHDASSTQLAAQGILESKQAWWPKLRDLSRHARHLLYSFSAVGRGRLVVPGLAERKTTGEDSPLLAESLPKHGGWLPLEVEASSQYAKRRERFLKRRQRYKQAVQAMSKRALRPPKLSPYQVLCIEHVAELEREYGFEAVFVILPLLDDMRAFHNAHAAGTIPRLLAFDDPLRFPELYTPEQRYDEDHLTRCASKRLTRQLVEQLNQLESGSR